MSSPTQSGTPTWGKVERELLGTPLAAGQRTIQPVARLTGWRGAVQRENGGGAGAWLRATPVEVIVREADGNEYKVPTTDATAMALRGILLAGLLVAIPCWLLSVILRRKSRRKASRLEVQE